MTQYHVVWTTIFTPIYAERDIEAPDLETGRQIANDTKPEQTEFYLNVENVDERDIRVLSVDEKR
jgi:hypothetical protein